MNRALKRLDSVHEKLVQTVTPLDPKIFLQRPSENHWSVAEIVQHLFLVEERVTEELEAAIAREPQRVGFLRRLIPTSIVSSRLLRVKAPKAMNPVVVPEKDVAIQNFDRARRNLKALCDIHGAERLRNLIFKHPFLGNIDGVATISFIGYHEHRHYKQIREVLKKIGQAGTCLSDLQPGGLSDSSRWSEHSVDHRKETKENQHPGRVPETLLGKGIEFEEKHLSGEFWHPFRVRRICFPRTGGLRFAATTGYYLKALQAVTESLNDSPCESRRT